MQVYPNQSPDTEGQIITICGTDFTTGDHVVLEIANNEKTVEWQITRIYDHTISLNGKLYQIDSFVSAKKLNLSKGILFVSILGQINNSEQSFIDAFEMSETDYDTCLKAVINTLVIKSQEFNRIEIPLYDASTNLKSIKDWIKTKLHLIQHIATLDSAKKWLEREIDFQNLLLLQASLRDNG